jgi:hypothetical protein
MKIKLLLSVLALVFTASAFAIQNDMYAYLRAGLGMPGVALNPAITRQFIRDFMDTGAPADAGIDSIVNENARQSLRKINAEIRTLTPWGAQAQLEEALSEAYAEEEFIVDELVASTVAYIMMWENFSRWMVSNGKIICPGSYTPDQCELFRVN